MNKPTATEAVVIERNNDRFITVHSNNEGLLDFIRAQDIWQYRHHVEYSPNNPTHCYGRISPIFDLEATITWLQSLTVDSLPIERVPDASLYEEAEDGLTEQFFDDEPLHVTEFAQMPALVQLAPTADESEGD